MDVATSSKFWGSGIESNEIGTSKHIFGEERRVDEAIKLKDGAIVTISKHDLQVGEEGYKHVQFWF